MVKMVSFVTYILPHKERDRKALQRKRRRAKKIILTKVTGRKTVKSQKGAPLGKRTLHSC